MSSEPVAKPFVGVGVPGGARHPKAGRQPGTPNKESSKVLAELLGMGVNPIREIVKLMASDTISDEKKAEIWVKVANYCYPMLKAMEIKGDIEHTVKASPENVAQLCRLAREQALAPAIIDVEAEDGPESERDAGGGEAAP